MEKRVLSDFWLVIVKSVEDSVPLTVFPKVYLKVFYSSFISYEIVDPSNDALKVIEKPCEFLHLSIHNTQKVHTCTSMYSIFRHKS